MSVPLPSEGSQISSAIQYGFAAVNFDIIDLITPSIEQQIKDAFEIREREIDESKRLLRLRRGVYADGKKKSPVASILIGETDIKCVVYDETQVTQIVLDKVVDILRVSFSNVKLKPDAVSYYTVTYEQMPFNLVEALNPFFQKFVREEVEAKYARQMHPVAGAASPQTIATTHLYDLKMRINIADPARGESHSADMELAHRDPTTFNQRILRISSELPSALHHEMVKKLKEAYYGSQRSR